jgi:hypothetical protein
MDAAAVERLNAVRAAVDAAAKDWGRDPATVNLIAVSKTFPAEDVRPVLAAGHSEFGENRVQEAAGKWPALRAEFGHARLHLIGPLQTNKCREAVALFDVIHTLDRMRLATALVREAERAGRSPQIFVQVNTGGEPQKSGVMPEEADAFLGEVRPLPLDIVGLMCLPPASDPPAPHFALLRKIAARHGLPRLSMGMSHDFETAIRFGATDIRVGTAIFGARASPD